MRHLFTLVVAGLLGSATGVADAHGQANPRQRTLLVTAVGENDTPVETLSANDVIVREDGMAREVVSVTRATEPVDITLLVDNSVASTRALQDMRIGLEKFVTAFAGPNPITLMTVADRPTVQVPSTTSQAQLLRGVKRLFIQPSSGATTVEGIIEASRAIEKRHPARAALIVVTSMGSEFSDRPYDLALDTLAKAGAVLHVLELQDTTRADTQSQSVRDRNIVIDRGTTETGGLRELLITNLSMSDALQKVGRAATTQFLVVYGRPDRLIPPRKVEVSSARPTLKVRGNTLPDNRAPR
ncbi:MAG: VWA domain-containing protein [Acidobacteria bacterium]|nr:VWA domain-containing protein [Acidobacteriota bacterium]